MSVEFIFALVKATNRARLYFQMDYVIDYKNDDYILLTKSIRSGGNKEIIPTVQL
jgi:hypothetical protein